MIVLARPNQNYTMETPIALIRACIWRKIGGWIFLHRVLLNKLDVFSLVPWPSLRRDAPTTMHPHFMLIVQPNDPLCCSSNVSMLTQFPSPPIASVMSFTKKVISTGVHIVAPKSSTFRATTPPNNMRTQCHLLSLIIDNRSWKWRWMKKNTCHDPNLGLMTKARAWKVTGW